MAEEPGKKFNVLAHAEIGIEIAAEALRHIGDLWTDLAAMAGVGHVAAEDCDMAFLDTARPGNQAQQRGFADAVGADESDHDSGRDGEIDRIERQRLAIGQRDAGKGGDSRSTLVHGMPSLLNCFGHLAFGSRRT